MLVYCKSLEIDRHIVNLQDVELKGQFLK